MCTFVLICVFQVCYNQLLKQRERMLREMEMAVARRENIVIRSEVQADSTRKHSTHAVLQNTMQNLHRSILQIHKARVCVFIVYTIPFTPFIEPEIQILCHESTSSL